MGNCTMFKNEMNRQQKPMRSRQLKGAAFTFLMLMALFFPSVLPAQVAVPFTQRTSQYSPDQAVYHLQGDFTMIGNTNMVDPNGGNTNDVNAMRWNNIDAANGAVTNSTSAELKFSTERGANPECTRVVYAGLYWVGRHDTRNDPAPERRVLRTVTLHNGEREGSISVSISLPDPSGRTRITNLSSGTSSGHKVIQYQFSQNNTVVSTPYINIERYSNGARYAIRMNSMNTGNDGAAIYNDMQWSSGTYQMRNITSLSAGQGSSDTYRANNPLPIQIAQVGDTIYMLTSVHWNNTSSNINNDYYVTLQVLVPEEGYAEPRRKVKFRHEDGTYTQVTAAQGNVFFPTIPSNAPNTINESDYYYGMYTAYAEVTDIVQEYGEGNYYVADIVSDLSNVSNNPIGKLGAWTLVVIYENTMMKWRDITVFDGWAFTGGANPNTDVAISGFRTVQVGKVGVKLGMAVMDGDRGSSTDKVYIQKLNTDEYQQLLNPSSDLYSTSDDNFFQSVIYTPENAARNPRQTNNYGIDIVVMDVPNENNSVMANEQTSTRFRYASTRRDNYAAFLYVMGVDAYIPDAQAIDAVMENASAVYDPDMDVWVSHPGDTVTFTIKVHNYDVEDIRDAMVTLPMPPTVEFYELEAEYSDGRTGEFYFDPLEGVNGTAHWSIDYLPAGYPDSVWATFKLHCYITRDCYVLASTSEECLLDLVVNGTLSGTSVINGVCFEHPFIQGFQQDGVCRGAAIAESLRVVIDRADYVRNHCDCSNGGGTFNTECYKNRSIGFCLSDGDVVPFDKVAKYYPDGTRFYLGSDRSVEYTYATGFPAAAQSTSVVAVLPTNSSCESSLTLVQTISFDTITLPAFVSNPVEYCMNDEPRPLSESIVIPDTSITNYGAQVIFFKSHPGDDPLHPDVPAYSDITPSTSAVGITSYWVVQIATAPGMECYHSTPMKLEVLVKSPLTISSDVESPSCVGVPVNFTPDVVGGEYDIPEEILPYVYINNQTSVATLSGTAPAGTYTFSYTAPPSTDPDGCPHALTQAITHTVTTISAGGHIIPLNPGSICQGSPVPDFRIDQMAGRVVRWEYRKGTDPWQVIPNNTTRINQSNLPELTQGTYQFRALVQSGDCEPTYSDTSSLTVSNYVAEAAPTGGVQYFCVGSEVTLSNPDNSGTYNWYTSEYGGEPDNANRTFEMTEAWEQRYVSQRSHIGDNVYCESQRALVEARPYFNAGAIRNGQQVVCGTGTINTIGSADDAAATVGVTGYNGAAPTFTYHWYMSKNGGAETSLSATTATLNPATYVSGNGTYTFRRTASFRLQTGVYGNGNPRYTNCGELPSDGTYKLILGVPDATIATPENTVLCHDGSIQLTLTAPFSSLFSYQWYRNGTAIIDANGSNYTATASGNYTVKVTDRASGCNATSSTPITLTEDNTSPVVSQSTISTEITSCSITALPAAYTTVAELESGLHVSISDNHTSDADLEVSHADDTTSTVCPFVVTRTYTIADECGNEATIEQTFTIQNETTPVITVASQNNPAGACNPTSITAPTFTVTDVCADTPTPTVSTTGPTGTGCAKSQTWTATYTSVCGVEATPVEVTYSWKEDAEKPTIGTIAAQDATPAGSCKYKIPGLTDVVRNVSSDNCTAGDDLAVSQNIAANTEYVQTNSEQNINVTVTVTDACGNEQTKTVVVKIPAKVTANVTSTTNIDCYDGETGAIELTATGGTPDYTYSWTGPNSYTSTDEDLTSLKAGTYAVTVTDDNGCTATANATLTQPASDISITLTPTNVLCNGKETGAITATVTGGTPDYDYEWGTGATTATVSGLSAGEYTVTVTDNKGCEKEASVTITEPATAVNITTINKTNVLCKDAANGTAEVVAEGGTLAAGHTYNYIWSNDATTASISNLAPATYTVTVTDDNECEATGEVKITEPTALTLTTEESNVSCAGSSNGSVNVTVSGGTSPYTYAWSGDATSSEEDLEDLGGGTYTLIVTDHNGCTVTETIEIEEPDVLSLGLSPVSETCDGGDGKITAAATGGTQFDLGGENPYYLYSWYRKTSATDSVLIASNVTQIDTLSAGNFTVVVKDANGCEAQASVTLKLDNPLAINTTLSANPTICSGGSFSFAPEDGEDGSVPDGTLYSWEAPVVENVSNTHAGVNQSTIHDEGIVYTGTAPSVDIPYNVVATYGEICQNSTTVTVTVSATVNGNMTIALTNDTVCPNVGTKTLTATLGNLTNNYDITWTFNGSETTQSRNQSETTPTLNVTIPSDNCNVVYPYTVSVEDELHCKNSKTGNIVVRIPDWNISEANGSKTVACPSAAVPPTLPTVTDGCGNTLTPQSIGFDPETDDPVTCSGTVEYKYRYTACDNSYKDWTYTYIIKDSIAPVLEDCSGLDEELTATDCEFTVPDFEDDVLDLASDNCTVAEYVQSPAAGTVITATTDVTVYVKDACGNESAHRTITVTVPAPVQLAEVTAEHVDVLCKNDATGSFKVSATQGKSPYTYTLGTTSNSTGEFSGLEDGTYTVTVTDANGCTNTVDVTINEPTAVLTASVPAPTAICNGGSQTLTVEVGGGTAGYGYQWSDGSNTNSITVSPTATTTYSVTVTDEHECTASDSKTLTVYSLPIVELDGVSDLCPNVGSTNLTAEITTTSAAPYKYEWTGMTVTPASTAGSTATSNTVSATIPTTCGASYTVTVTLTDNHGCTVTDDATVTVKTPATPSIALADGTDASTNLGCNPASIPTVTKDNFVVTDECDASAIATVTPGDEQVDGCTHSKTWTASYTNSCVTAATSKTVTYTWTVTTAPEVTPSDELAESGTVMDCNWDYENEGPTSADFNLVSGDCETDPDVTVTSKVTGDCTKTGIWTAKYENQCGQKDSVKVTYTWTADEEGPAITGTLEDINVAGCDETAVPAAATTVAALEEMGVEISDNCSSTFTVSSEDADASGACVKTVVRTYTVTDACGNSSTATQNIIITPADFISNMPEPGEKTVSCAASVGTPATPTVEDACGNVITDIELKSKTDNPSCEGTVVYTYTYTDCAGHSHDWTYTYTIDLPIVEMPADGRDTVPCEIDAQHTPTPPELTDACGRTLQVVQVGDPVSTVGTNGRGTVTYTFEYTDCTGEDYDYEWQYVYYVIPDAFTPRTNGSSNISCLSDAVTPTLPAITVCGESVELTLVSKVDSTENGCGKYIYTYGYTVNDVEYTWKYTYNVSPADFADLMPDNGGSTVSCEAAAVAPTAPVVENACGTAVTISEPVVSGTYEGCEGTIIYTYTYSDCAGHSHDWTYTYIIKHDANPTQVGTPVDTASTVECVSAATVPTVLPVVKDACGNVVVHAPAPEVGGTYTDCEGTKTYTYTYEDCAGKQFVWTYTYTIGHSTAPAEVGGPVATRDTVECESAAAAPATLPVVKDVCGNVLDAPEPEVATDIHGCEGTVVYTYT
ncbi:MAG: hypothetical protein MJZ70_00545, partial [Bacteroidales bacterium]|nr:hypothetical protein [Bacteroidales bacterium]